LLLSHETRLQNEALCLTTSWIVPLKSAAIVQRGMIIVAKTRHADRAAMALSVSGAHEVAPKLSRLVIKIALY